MIITGMKHFESVCQKKLVAWYNKNRPETPIDLLWYYIVGAVIVAFIVYLVATGGWEKVSEMWRRTKYNKSNKIK